MFAEEIWEDLAPQCLSCVSHVSLRCVYALRLTNKHQRFFPENVACTLLQALHRKFFCVTLFHVVFNFDKSRCAELFFLYFSMSEMSVVFLALFE